MEASAGEDSEPSAKRLFSAGAYPFVQLGLGVGFPLPAQSSQQQQQQQQQQHGLPTSPSSQEPLPAPPLAPSAAAVAAAARTPARVLTRTALIAALQELGYTQRVLADLMRFPNEEHGLCVYLRSGEQAPDVPALASHDFRARAFLAEEQRVRNFIRYGTDPSDLCRCGLGFCVDEAYLSECIQCNVCERWEHLFCAWIPHTGPTGRHRGREYPTKHACDSCLSADEKAARKRQLTPQDRVRLACQYVGWSPTQFAQETGLMSYTALNAWLRQDSSIYKLANLGRKLYQVLIAFSSLKPLVEGWSEDRFCEAALPPLP